MMQAAKCVAIVFVSTLLMSGCAGTTSKTDRLQRRYAADVGVATSFDFLEKTQRIFNKYHYQIERYEEYRDRLYLETQWKYRVPFQDEKDLGIVEAKTRIIVQAKARVRGTGVTKLNRVEFIGENLVLFVDSPQWRLAPLTTMLKAYFKEVVEELTTEFRTGIRKY